MDAAELDELCLEAEADVTGCHEVEDTNLSPSWKPQGTPKKGDAGINGMVAMETRREKLMRKKEEERWAELYPEIKKCVIVVVRQRLDRLNVKPKHETNAERREGEGGGGQRSEDPQSSSHWTKPLEQDDSDGEVRLRSFVKKVEVTDLASCAPADGPRRPCGRVRVSSLLRLRQCPDVTLDPVDSAHPDRSLQRSKSLMERWRRISNKKQMENNKNISQSETEHNYSITTRVPDSPDPANSQSQDARHKDGDLRRCSTEKKNPSTIVFKKVEGGQWVLRQSEVKKEEEEVEEEEEEEDSSTNTEQKLWGLNNKQTPTQRNRRRSACRKCAGCLREDCGKCIHCLDMRKFGGPMKRKQKCQLRVCLVLETGKKHRQQSLETPSEEPVSKEHHWKRRRDEHDVMQKKKEVIRAVKRRRRWGGNRVTPRWMRMEAEEEEMKKGKKNTHSAKEVKSRWRRRRRWGRRTAKPEPGEDNDWTQPLEKEEKEEEPKKETRPPQFSVSPADRVSKVFLSVKFLQFALVHEAGELLPEGQLTGTHMQLNLTLSGSHLTPSILSDSTLTINSLSGVLPQQASVLHESTGLAASPPPSPRPPLLQPKEEEEAVEISGKGADGGRREEELCTEGVTDRGEYYEMEVEVPDSDEETVPMSPFDITEVTSDVTASDPTHKPPEFIPLSSGSFRLLGDKVSDEVTCGRGLLRLLRVLRKTVLPAHWVPVLVDGPALQLLQCSKLSSMADTFVHIQPDLRFCISVQNRPLPDTHSVYRTHTQRITHLSQLVSLLLEMERLVVCRGSRVRSSTGRPDVRSPTCHLLVAPPCLTCLPCLLGGEEEEEEEEEEETEVEDDEGWDEVREDELTVSLSPPLL